MIEKYLQDPNVIAVDQLLKAGADPNAKNDSFESALMLACGSGNVEIANLLLQNKAELEARSTYYNRLLGF